MTHKSEDYKISAVKYYLKNKDNIRKTCKIFDCKKSTLQRWIQRYNSTKNLTRRNRKPLSYKNSKPQVNTALDLLKQNEQLSKVKQFPINNIICLDETSVGSALKPTYSKEE
jgi:transposase-like protein